MKYDFDLDLVNNNSLYVIIKEIKSNAKILEFGPANGRMTKYLKEQLDCEVYLAEIDEEAGKEALQYGVDLVIGDVENMEWFEQYKDLRFDYIIFADVLEHLRDPERVLNKAKLLLKETGSVILSVPNVAHNSIIINLLNNEFNYTDVGLLDNTHIHLFTKNSLEQMIQNAGFVVEKRMGTYLKVGENEIQNTTSSVPGIPDTFWNARKYGEVYQYIYVIKNGREYVEEEENYLKPILNHYYSQVFYGEDYSEDNTKKQYMNEVKGIKTFEIDCKNSDSIRFDPVNTACMMRLNNLQGSNEQEALEIVVASTNAAFVQDNMYFFTTDDPIMILESEGSRPMSKITIEVEFLQIDKNLVNSMVSFILNSIEADGLSKEEHINNINMLRDEICSIRSENEEMHKTIERLEQKTVEQESIRIELEKAKEEYEKTIQELMDANKDQGQQIGLMQEQSQVLHEILKEKDQEIIRETKGRHKVSLFLRALIKR